MWTDYDTACIGNVTLWEEHSIEYGIKYKRINRIGRRCWEVYYVKSCYDAAEKSKKKAVFTDKTDFRTINRLFTEDLLKDIGEIDKEKKCKNWAKKY